MIGETVDISTFRRTAWNYCFYWF